MFQRASLCEISIWSNNGVTTPGIPQIPYAAQKTRMVQSYNRASLEGERTMPFRKHAMQRAKANGAQALSSCTHRRDLCQRKSQTSMVASERDPPLGTVSSPGSGCSVFGFPAHGQDRATRNGPIASDLGADNRRGKGIHAWFVLFLY